MGFKLKNLVKTINPLEWGSKSGPSNPYGQVDPSGLLKVDTKNTYADQLFKPYATTPTAGSFWDSYKAPAETAGGYFDKYTQAIGAPSSVQDVQKEIEGERYQAALRDIGRATDVGAGRVVGTMLNRGIYGDGSDSDIARIGIAQSAQQGQEAAARAGLDYQGKDLERLAAKESALREAYGQQYQAGVATDSQMRELAARAAQGDQAAKQAYDMAAMSREDEQRKLMATVGEAEAARKSGNMTAYYQILSGLYTGGANREQAGTQGGYLDSLLRNVSVSVPIRKQGG